MVLKVFGVMGHENYEGIASSKKYLLNKHYRLDAKRNFKTRAKCRRLFDQAWLIYRFQKTSAEVFGRL